MADKTGLKALLTHKETVQPNDSLLNTLESAIFRFHDKIGKEYVS